MKSQIIKYENKLIQLDKDEKGCLLCIFYDSKACYCSLTSLNTQPIYLILSRCCLIRDSYWKDVTREVKLKQLNKNEIA